MRINKQNFWLIVLFFLLNQWLVILSVTATEFVASSEQDFSHPHDLVLDPSEKYLLVSDMQNDVIRVVDPLSLQTVATIGEGELSAPHDVSFDSQGRLLVADSGNNRIVIYRFENGTATISTTLTGNMRSPEGVCADSKGNIYVTSTGNHRVLKFRNNKLLKQTGGHGNKNIQFIRPHDIEMGADARLYVGDPGNNRIQVLSDNLEFIETIQPKMEAFNEPKYLALNDKNYLFVADQHNNSLRIFDPQRSQVHSISKAGKHMLNKIEGVEYISGKLWISDTYNNRVVLFNWSP